MSCLLIMLLCGCGLVGKRGGETPPPSPEAELDRAWAASSDPVPYTVDIRVVGAPQEMAAKMRALSSLERLAKEPPDSLLGLERRARADVAVAVSLLRSQCYYEGTADFRMDDKARPVAVTLLLTPGRRYRLGRADVYYDADPVIPDFFTTQRRPSGFLGLQDEAVPPPDFPRHLPKVAVGRPVIADDLLAAVEAVPEHLRREGYPLAEVVETSFTLDRNALELNADVLVRPGPPAMLGQVKVRGNKDVSAEFVRRLAPWLPDELPWNADTVEDYANYLRGIGLFRSVEVKPLAAEMMPGARGAAASLPLEVQVAEAPMRSVGVSARYDTDTGLGGEGTWEHRNLFHNGEKLTLSAPLATQVQGLKAKFEKPAFLSRGQKLLAGASALHEDTEAYERTGAAGSVGLERHLSRHWWGSVGLGGEGGALKDDEHGTRRYSILGPQVGVRRDTRDSRINPAEGTLLTVTARPSTGYYGAPFNALGGTLGVNAYYAPFRKKTQPDGPEGPDDRFVLAGRAEVGMLTGAKLEHIPTSMRYFAGGAGSVRGYAYQSIGPRKRDEPIGGRSYQVVNLEARCKITDAVGIVPFLDGGMVYRDDMPRLTDDMKWGAGLGLRYYTPIGPVRLDVGVPLQPIKGDPPVQIYVSIGQAF